MYTYTYIYTVYIKFPVFKYVLNPKMKKEKEIFADVFYLLYL